MAMDTVAQLLKNILDSLSQSITVQVSGNELEFGDSNIYKYSTCSRQHSIVVTKRYLNYCN